jgi:nucleotide-binding universal stress UspA family protein
MSIPAHAIAPGNARWAAGGEPPPHPFASVLCGIDGTGPDVVVARQGALLTRPGGHLELASVAAQRASGSGLTLEQARRALRRAAEIAHDLGPVPVGRVLEAADESAALLAEAEGFEALVVGFHGTGRFSGIVRGSTASAAVHRAPSAVLIARDPSYVPIGPVLLADDGTEASDEAAKVCAGLAGRFGGRIEVITCEHPHRSLPELAEQLQAPLIVMGSRGLHGPRALASVSERVAHSAPCSVLVVRSSAG